MTVADFAVRFLIAIIIGYLLGSIPFGVLIGRRMAKVDVRNYGSGKMGTTNVLRVAGKKAAALVALLDVSKGAVAVIIAGLIVGNNYMVVSVFGLGRLAAEVFAALAAMVGHTWPIFLKFHGGRGVATFFGGLIALCPAAAFFGGEIGLLGASLTRFASLGSIAGAVGTYTILVPLTIINGFPIEYILYALFGTIAILATHRDNISRLLAGKERRLGEKAEKANPSPTKTDLG
ncbi:MAG: glycerol-3-phosphate 1-O-acyltransferase PlsY [Chloroflexota bacterium]